MSQHTPVEILREAKALIERGWCKEAFARTKNGAEVDVLDTRACRFCVVGAVARSKGEPVPGTLVNYRLATDPTFRVLIGALHEMEGELGWSRLDSFNDGTSSKKRVLRLFDRAIALAESEAKP